MVENDPKKDNFNENQLDYFLSRIFIIHQVHEYWKISFWSKMTLKEIIQMILGQKRWNWLG